MSEIVKTVWDFYHIDHAILKKINDKALYTASYENEKYWFAVKKFVLEVRDIPYKDFSLRSRNWMHNIIEDLKDNYNI